MNTPRMGEQVSRIISQTPQAHAFKPELNINENNYGGVSAPQNSRKLEVDSESRGSSFRQTFPRAKSYDANSKGVRTALERREENVERMS